MFVCKGFLESVRDSDQTIIFVALVLTIEIASLKTAENPHTRSTNTITAGGEENLATNDRCNVLAICIESNGKTK